MRFSNKELFLQVTELRRELGPTIQNAADVPDHENRIRALERWKYAIPPAIVGAIASFVETFWRK